jgi:hypothetical protein
VSGGDPLFNHPNGVALDQARSAAVVLGAKVVSRVGVPGFLVQGYSVVRTLPRSYLAGYRATH